MSLGHLKHSPIDQLRAKFLEELGRMGAASKPGDRLLIILIGHGNDDPFGLVLGDIDETDPRLASRYLIVKQDVDDILRSYSPLISQCIISNSCFAGGWKCSNSTRSSMLAVSSTELSDSFNRSSSGGFRGGYFTAALCDTLRKHQACETSYRQHTENIMESLENLWALLVEANPPEFAAQYDAWDDGVTSNTSLAQIEYRRRFEALAEVPANPAEEETDRQQGSRRSRYVKSLIQSYRLLNPGRPTAASNNNIESRIGTFEGRHAGITATPKDIGWLAIALNHRVNMAFCASVIVAEAGFTPFPRFSTWSYDDWPFKKTWNEHAYEDMTEVLGRFRILLPPRPEFPIKSYWPFMKPKQYIICAAIAKGLDRLELHRRLARIQLAFFPLMQLPSDVY